MSTSNTHRDSAVLGMARRECRTEEAASYKEWALISYKQGSYPAQDPRRTLKLTFREERNHRLTPWVGEGEEALIIPFI